MKSIKDKMAAIEAGAAKAAGADYKKDRVPSRPAGRQLNEMTIKELKAVADDLGLGYDPKIKKEELVSMIAAEPAQTGEPAVADSVIIDADLPVADPGAEDPQCTRIALQKKSKAAGHVMVTYTGMVNLRDDQMRVVGQAMQGQVFPVVAKLEQDGKTWFRVEDQAGKQFLISADVVRYMVG